MVIGLVGQVGSAQAANTTYYVDDTGGSDSYNGQCQTVSGGCGPWQTLSKVNSTTFGPGDRLLFKKGGSWAGQLRPLGSGSSGSPITLDAYGSSTSRPVIHGGGTANGTGAVYLRNQQYWVIQNLEVTNSAANHDNTYRGGILVENNGGGTLNYIRIFNNYVHNVTSSYTYQDGHDPISTVVLLFMPAAR